MGNTLGERLKKLRLAHGLSLTQLSRASGVSKASLSKVENDRMSMSYAQMQKLGVGLGISVSELLYLEDAEPQRAIGRRSINRVDDPVTTQTDQYCYTYLHTDLLKRSMTPFRMTLKARTMDAFGELLRHPGEEFIVVMDGQVEVHTELYAPVLLDKGDTLYIDSGMGHAYLSVGSTDAVIICVCDADHPIPESTESTESGPGL